MCREGTEGRIYESAWFIVGSIDSKELIGTDCQKDRSLREEDQKAHDDRSPDTAQISDPECFFRRRCEFPSRSAGTAQ